MQPVCSLRKEKKKLAKTLKAHRKRLERILNAAEAVSSTAALAEIYTELKRVRELLAEAGVGKLTATLNADSSSSDSSDSDCDKPHKQSITHHTPEPGFARASVNSLLAVADLQVPDLLEDLEPPVSYQTSGRIVVCQGSKCRARGATDLLRAASHLTSSSPGIEVIPCKCMGKCAQAPAMRVRASDSGAALVGGVTQAELPAILDQHFSS